MFKGKKEFMREYFEQTRKLEFVKFAKSRMNKNSLISEIKGS